MAKKSTSILQRVKSKWAWNNYLKPLSNKSIFLSLWVKIAIRSCSRKACIQQEINTVNFGTKRKLSHIEYIFQSGNMHDTNQCFAPPEGFYHDSIRGRRQYWLSFWESLRFYFRIVAFKERKLLWRPSPGIEVLSTSFYYFVIYNIK